MEQPILCLVCNGPSALFKTEGKETYRLAKTMLRVTAKGADIERAYVHETPCLNVLVRDWAKYIVNEQGLKALAKRENESNQQANPGNAGEDKQGLDS